MFEILKVRIMFDTRSVFTFTIYIRIKFHVRSFVDSLLQQLNRKVMKIFALSLFSVINSSK